MEGTPHRISEYNLVPLLVLSFFLVPSSSVHSLQRPPPLLGVHPLDEKFFASEVIKCKDGSNSFTRDRLNDNFCDCIDGTDEPGTSACPTAKFYCKNLGSVPLFIFSSRVNDHICDCCDGSDEYDTGIRCPNTCVMGGNLEYKYGNYITYDDANESKNRIVLEDLLEKTKGLKMVIIVQIILLGFVVIIRVSRRHIKSKRRQHR